MATKTTKQTDDDGDLESLTGDLQGIADEWRDRLADPALKSLIESGKAQVSPLIQKLLKAFPPKSAKE